MGETGLVGLIGLTGLIRLIGWSYPKSLFSAEGVVEVCLVDEIVVD